MKEDAKSRDKDTFLRTMTPVRIYFMAFIVMSLGDSKLGQWEKKNILKVNGSSSSNSLVWFSSFDKGMLNY